MKKTLFFAAVLLVPSLAHSADPSADLSVQVVPPSSNGIACDIGPKYTGAIPAAATQAGFTHCAANYDFTQTASFTDSKGTHTWSNLSTWFTCQNGNAPSSFLMNHQTNGVEVGCDLSHQNVVKDSGVQVLALSYFLTDKNAGLYSNSLNTACCGGNVPPYGYDFPSQSYIEQVFRETPTVVCSAGCLTWAPFYYSSVENTNPCFVEEDFGETGGNDPTGGTNTALGLWNPTCGTGGHNYGPATSPPSAKNSDFASYSTLGSLFTMDGVSSIGACGYWSAGIVNGLPASSFKSCISPWGIDPPSNSSVFTARLRLIFDEGPESPGNGGDNWTGASHTTYLQRMTVWVGGPNWRTASFYNNPVITGGP
jgi:hypothetical protein